jgi:hypothetical protein
MEAQGTSRDFVLASQFFNRGNCKYYACRGLATTTVLSAESSGTNGTAMTAQYARPTVVRNPENLENSFRNIYSGFLNGIRIPTDGVHHVRLTNLTNEEGWIEVKKKVKKVTFKKQVQFGKTKRFGRIDRSNLKKSQH